jgi:Na+-transporting methylmalonyl-CoA/oxaloacetate decarboxylase gamma subunit
MIDMTAFLETLPIMGKGMAGIFIVMMVILFCIKGMGKVFPE